jgi:hypothetical protein
MAALPDRHGRIAQLVEQLTLNQRVPGSSPGASTIRGRDAQRDVLTLEEAVTRKLGATAQVSAASLLGPAQAASGQDFLKRAMNVIGVIETGTADCEDVLKVTRQFIGYGCIWVAPGPTLGRFASEAESASPGLVRRIMGPREEDLRGIEGESALPDDPDFVARLGRLAATAEFRAARDRYIMAYYQWSEAVARRVGLTSDRGRLFLFDRSWNSGRSTIEKIADTALEDPQFGALSEQDKLLRLAEIGKARLSPMLPEAARRNLGRRMDMFATGKGRIGDVTFDLDALGFRLS